MNDVLVINRQKHSKNIKYRTSCVIERLAGYEASEVQR